LTSALDGMSGQRHGLVTFYPRETTPGTHWIGDWLGLRDGLDTKARENALRLCWESNPGRPVCSQTL
jgi:hypothetical protein